MPTNGAFDDVLVRLPAAFLERDDGTPDLQIYKTNLAITEALVRRQNVPIAATDERALDSDLDRDGQLGTATRIAYDWAPVEKRETHSVGRARREQDAGRVHAAAGLFPERTPFLPSVPHITIAGDGPAAPAAPPKDIR